MNKVIISNNYLNKKFIFYSHQRNRFDFTFNIATDDLRL